VQIEDDLRMPDVVELGDGEARFSLREEIPVAVEVVAGVLVAEPRRRRALERRAQGLSVPAGDQVQAIGIERGHEQKDGVIEDGAEARRVLGEQTVDELDGGMGGGEFGRVNRAGDEKPPPCLRRSAFPLRPGA